MTFDSIEFDPFRFAYIVRRDKRRWDVPLDLIRNIRDPDYLDAVNAAADAARREGRVTAAEAPSGAAPPPRRGGR